ncbi:molybdopterin synthase sulfur carrier subunit [Parasphingorhabdus marina DSM 22363]|uniref:Molybdopterin synthase sulfur carrier subunit n=1 Tax=Parasphingorhabdus marina DSM 22363 TaxID=1123272 RepID=A0A1N6F383_9SPHN|nr:molybdopterin converting factor subunit 1 [Parasphingorhabdus marina]SIN89707.1 molybdopterin synthase sulfur carrier subunit [Parasphingorhabdus marina DSM 22363]
MAGELDIVYFAWVKERLGRPEDRIAVPDGVSTVGGLIDYLCQQDASYDQVFADRSRLRFALDQQLVHADAKLDNSRELAIFPPVTGG